VNLSSLARASQRKLHVNLFPKFFVDNPFVFAGGGSFVGHSAFIKDILQQQPKRHPAEGSGRCGFPDRLLEALV
jgi:hypothetical protein